MRFHVIGFCFRSLKKTGYASLLLIFSLKVHAQNISAPANKVKAVFLFNFTRFIDWPPAAFKTPDAPFIIGIIPAGNSINTYIEESVAGEKMGNHPIIVKRFEDLTEIDDCHLLYIGIADEKQIQEILASMEYQSVLTVGESPDFNKLGGIIRFHTVKDRIRLEINTEACKAAQLNISSKLLNVAKSK